MKLKVINLDTVNSTNDSAKKKIRSGLSYGIVVAKKQLKGRGQYGRKWISFVNNLHISLFMQINKRISLATINKFNLKSIKKSIAKFTKKKISIKYPNDLIINKEKICGILQETIIFNNNKFLIVGVGINISKSPILKNYPTGYLNKYAKSKVLKKSLIKEIKINYEKNLKNSNVCI
tara:strand:- start:220 stop:750 length:531 start_codon:yes stop_codon:yes gene_type:complete